MKKIIILVFLMLRIIGVAQIEDVTLDDFRLKGKVKSVNQKNFYKIDVETPISDSLSFDFSYTEFDKDGYIKKMKKQQTNYNRLSQLYASGHEIEGKYKYSDYKIIENINRDKVVLDKKRLIELNTDWVENYTIIEADTIRKQKSSIKEVVTYDDQKGTAVVRNVKNDTLYAKKMVRLNRNQQILEQISFDETNQKKEIITNTYDEKNNLVSKNVMNFFTKENVTRKYTYDEQGNPIEEQITTPRGGMLRITKKYNQYNDVIEETAHLNEQIFTNTTTYKYDNHQNYIEKIELTNDKKKIVTRRKIEYFE